jgi:DNA-binding LacI/PurR family transcriptional regulator
MASGMKDVATHARVSITTVSHVLNKTRYVAPETRKRVQEAIRELRFYKDAHARRLASGRSNFFGLIVSDITNPFFPELIRGFESAALSRRFDTLLCDTNYDPRRAEAGVRMMIENKVRGVAVMTSELAPTLAQDFTANHVAVVSLGLLSVGLNTANIRVDQARGIHQAIDHLRSLGHEDIAFISGPEGLQSARARREAFVSGLHHHGLNPGRTLVGNHKIDGGIEGVRQLVAEGKLPTAILCSNDLTAIGAMEALGEAGFRVPDDVSIIGFDDIFFASITTPPLTTVHLPQNRMGELAFAALQEILRTKKRRGREYTVRTELVIRKSTAAPQTIRHV